LTRNQICRSDVEVVRDLLRSEVGSSGEVEVFGKEGATFSAVMKCREHGWFCISKLSGSTGCQRKINKYGEKIADKLVKVYRTVTTQDQSQKAKR
jgi:hypothetical protein